jgi:Bacterial alpha-L-rhamnosidase.
MEEIAPISFEKIEDGTYKADFGKVITGWVKLSGIKVRKGDTLKVNHLSEYPAGRCEYIAAADGAVTASTRFTWFSFREAIISGASEIQASNLTAQVVNSNVRAYSEFKCSNPLFEQIEKIWRQSQLDNMHSGVATDCPHRERLPYTGDGQIAMPMVVDNFDAAAFYNKWIGDIKGSQNPESGYVPNGAPWEPCCGGGPAWGAAICVMPWEFYCRYGDKDMLAGALQPMKEYVRYLSTWEQPDGTINVHRPTPDGREFYWYNLGDWAPAYQIPEDALVHTFYYWLCASITSKTAKALGDEATASEYAALAAKVKDAFNSHWYNAKDKTYGDFGCNVYALYMGQPEDRLEDVRATLRNELMVKYKGHLNVGFIANRFLYETLSLNGMGDVACTLLSQKDFPSFGWWLEQGATTTWEQWSGADSRNHPMFGGGLIWFYRILAGVTTDPAEPGFRHVIIRPVPVKTIENVEYTTETPYGKLSSRVTIKDGAVKMSGVIPFGSHATIYVPKSLEAAASAPAQDDSYEIHEAGPGEYSF